MKQIGNVLTAKLLEIGEMRKRTADHPGSEPVGSMIDPEEDFQCPLCKDRGIILEGDVGIPCSCSKQKALQHRFKNSHFGRDLRQFTPDKFQLQYYRDDVKDTITGQTFREQAGQALTAARDFVTDAQAQLYGDGLLFTGNVGSGKTFLASIIANSLLNSGLEVLYIVVPDLLDEIRATFDHRSDTEVTEQYIMEKARTVEILILDDLGAHNYTDWARNRLYSIINYRLNHELRTVVTTNLLPQELEEYIGERSTSRLAQMCQTRRLSVSMDIRYHKHHEKQQS